MWELAGCGSRVFMGVLVGLIYRIVGGFLNVLSIWNF